MSTSIITNHRPCCGRIARARAVSAVEHRVRLLCWVQVMIVLDNVIESTPRRAAPGRPAGQCDRSAYRRDDHRGRGTPVRRGRIPQWTISPPEARRGLFDPTYGRYTWGKLTILDARERARTAWGSGFNLPRFHTALLALGAPPIGLLDTAIEQG